MPIKWLDLCCGNGNILSQISDTIGDRSSSIYYHGLDIDIKYVNKCNKIIKNKQLNEKLAYVKIEVHDITKPFKSDVKFDIITLLNVLHEINPFNIISIFKNALVNSKQNGLLLIVDMCELPHLEWKSITWSRDTLSQIITPFLKNKNDINTLVSPVPINIYPRSVNIIALRLKKDMFDMSKFSNLSESIDEIVINCLKTKMDSISKQIIKIYEMNSDLFMNKNNEKLNSINSSFSKLLWEYWSVNERLNDYRVANKIMNTD